MTADIVVRIEDWLNALALTKRGIGARFVDSRGIFARQIMK